MLKKLFAAMCVLSLLLVQSTAMAAGVRYPRYLGGDKNYIFFDGHQGGARYLVRNSLNVELYAPPNYIISVDWVYVGDALNGSTEIDGKRHVSFSYNWNTKQVYQKWDDRGWGLIDPKGIRASGSAFALGAEIAFWLAYGMKFYAISEYEDFYPDR